MVPHRLLNVVSNQRNVIANARFRRSSQNSCPESQPRRRPRSKMSPHQLKISPQSLPSRRQWNLAPSSYSFPDIDPQMARRTSTGLPKRRLRTTSWTWLVQASRDRALASKQGQTAMRKCRCVDVRVKDKNRACYIPSRRVAGNNTVHSFSSSLTTCHQSQLRGSKQLKTSWTIKQRTTSLPTNRRQPVITLPSRQRY